MTVKELFADFNYAFSNSTIFIRDICTGTEHDNNIGNFMGNKDLYTDWKNAKVCKWFTVDREIILIVEKGVKQL